MKTLVVLVLLLTGCSLGPLEWAPGGAMAQSGYECTTHTFFDGYRTVICRTCCYYGRCTTSCV